MIKIFNSVGPKMKPYTLKQRLILPIVWAIEWMVNSKRMVRLLNFVSRWLLKMPCHTARPVPYKKSYFKGLHVAFIADGNRRHYMKTCSTGWMPEMRSRSFTEEACAPRSTNASGASRSFCCGTQEALPPATAGNALVTELSLENHRMRGGVMKITELIEFAYFYGLKEVSLYCFSIKNFQRKKEEVADIMDIIKNNEDLKIELPVRINVFGNMELLDGTVRRILERWEQRTAHNVGLVVNIFFSYSSSCESSDAQFTNPVDLLIRTSGVKRLSDFMVRQVAGGTAVDFVSPLWPEFSLMHLWLTLAKYRLEEAYLRD